MWRLCPLVAVLACGRVGFNATGATADDATDTTIDARRTFGTPIRHSELETPDEERDPALTADMLEIYFTRHGGDQDIYVATRASTSVPFGAPMPVPALSTGAGEDTPEVSFDGLSLYLGVGGSGADLYLSSRPDRQSPWGVPVLVPELTTAVGDRPGTLTADGLTLYLQVGVAGTVDLYVATRATTGSTWNTPTPLSELNTVEDEADPATDPVGTDIFFTRGVIGDLDIWRAHRDDVGMPFRDAARVEELRSPVDDSDPWISPSGDRVFFSSARDGTRTLYEATLQ